MINVFPRESAEFQPILITRDGVLMTTGVAYAVTAVTARPTTFTTATTLGSEIGFIVTGLSVGTYKVWAQITDSPEIPVIDCGNFVVS